MGQVNGLDLEASLVKCQRSAGRDNVAWLYVVPSAQVSLGDSKASGEGQKVLLVTLHVIVDSLGQIGLLSHCHHFAFLVVRLLEVGRHGGPGGEEAHMNMIRMAADVPYDAVSSKKPVQVSLVHPLAQGIILERAMQASINKHVLNPLGQQEVFQQGPCFGHVQIAAAHGNERLEGAVAPGVVAYVHVPTVLVGTMTGHGTALRVGKVAKVKIAGFGEFLPHAVDGVQQCPDHLGRGVGSLGGPESIAFKLGGERDSVY